MIDEDGEPLGEAVGHAAPGPPERRLWQAVVLQALADAADDAPRGAPWRAEAVGWLEATDWRFRLVCDLAGLEPYWVKRKWNGGWIRKNGRGRWRS